MLEREVEGRRADDSAQRPEGQTRGRGGGRAGVIEERGGEAGGGQGEDIDRENRGKGGRAGIGEWRGRQLLTCG